MKKFTRGLILVLLCVAVALAAVACSGGETPSTDPVAPKITNKPAGNTLTITDTVSTYQFTTDYTGTAEWRSTVSSVAEISQEGLLTLKSAGATEIMLKDPTTQLSDSVVLTVYDERTPEDETAAPKIKNKPSSALVITDDENTYLFEVEYDGTVEWSSSNLAVAEISQDGLLTMKTEGETTVFAKDLTTLKYDSVTVTINDERTPIEDEVSPEITNKPEGGALTLTDSDKTYQFNLDYSGSVEWISSETSVATISQNGLLTMLKGGSTVITVQDTTDARLSDSVAITITDERRAYSLEITGMPEGFIRVGHASITLSAKDREVGDTITATWSTNNPSVATVGETTGEVAIIGAGTVTITATKSDDATVSDTLTFTVLGKAPTSVSIVDVPKYGMAEGATYTLSTVVEDELADDFAIEWDTDDPTVATVDEDGVVTTLAAGTVKITATAKGEGMEDVVGEQTVTVYAIESTHTDFRFAQISGNLVTGTGLKGIRLTATQGEIIDLGDDEQNMALQITTEESTDYNNVEFNFGEHEAGSYKIMIRFVVLSGTHSGSIAVPGVNPYATLPAMSFSGNHTYSFIFNHATTGDLMIRIVNAAYKASVVIIDDVSVESFTASVGALGESVTFDDEIDLAANGIYSLFGAELSVENNALTVEGGSVALFLGNVTGGRYTLKFDATLEGGYPAVGKIVSDAGADEVSGVFWGSNLETLVGAENGLAAYAKKSGEKTYTLNLNFASDYNSVAIIFCDGDEATNGSVTIENLSFVKETFAEAVTIADFESGAVTTGNWNTGFALKYAVSNNFDFQNGASNASNLTIASVAEESADGGTNHFYKQNTASVNYVRVLVGYLPAGTYEFTVRAKAESGNGALQITFTTGATANATQLDYHSNAAGGAFVLRTGSAGDAKNATWSLVGSDSWGGTYNSTEWATYKCTLELTKDWYVRFGIGRGTGSNVTGTVCVDDITVQKIA